MKQWSDFDEEDFPVLAREPVIPLTNGHDSVEDDAVDRFRDSLDDRVLPELSDDGPPFHVEPSESRARPLTAAQAHQPYREPVGPDTWPEPLDLTKSLYRGLPLSLEYVPDALKPILSDFRLRTGIEMGAAFLGFLGALSTFANDFIRLQPKQNDYTWTVRPCLWFFAIGGSSSGKTPALEAGMKIVQDKDLAHVVENTRKRKEYEHQLDIYADECAVARKGKLPRPEEPSPPVLREFWVQRGTTEGVTRVLETSPKVCWYMGEGSGLINSWDRYAPGGKGSGDREFVLMLWDGGPGKNTLAGKTVALNNASAVLGGGSTPGAMLNSCAGKLQADGFLQRTLLCMVPDMVDGTDTAPDGDALAAYARVLDGLLDMAMPATIRLGSDAQQIYSEFCERLKLLISHEENEALAAHIGKWFGTAPRLMLVYYLTECAAAGQLVTNSHRVPARIARQVCEMLMNWQLTHVQQFWHELMANKAGRGFSQTIARYILANPQLKRLNFRDHISNPHADAIEKLKPWEIKEAINTLVNAAWLTPIEGRLNNYGLAAAYVVNPGLPNMFEAQRQAETERRTSVRARLQAQRLDAP